MESLILIAAVAIACAAGAVRGITGFGGATVMSSPLALLLGPRVAVPVVLLPESIIAAPMLWQTRQSVNLRVMGAGVCSGTPCGGTGGPQPVELIPTLSEWAMIAMIALLAMAGWLQLRRRRR